MNDASQPPPTRTIKVEALTRVEGEGGLHVDMRGDVVESVQLTIYEPPRFFEAFLRGRPLKRYRTSPPASAASVRLPTR